MGEFQGERVIPQHHEEEPTARGSQHQGAEDHLPDAATSGDPRHEEPDEGRVGDPPGPIENRPVLDEAGLRDGIGPEIHANEILEYVAHRRRAHLDDEESVAREEHKGHEAQGEHQVHVAENADAPFEPHVDTHGEDQ